MLQHIDVVLYYLRKKSKLRSPNQYRFTTINCLFKTYINVAHIRYYCNPPDENLSTQDHIARGVVEFAFERSIKNIIKGFSIPVGLPWHLVDDVYISVNSYGKFHWVLAVVSLKERLIRVYDSSLSIRIKVSSGEIKKLAILLSSYLPYLHDIGFFDQTEQTDWSSLDVYNDSQTSMLLGPEHVFQVEFIQDIMQQESDSLDCGMFVAAFAEFLSDGLPVPKIGFYSVYLGKLYGALLWKYGTEKAKTRYISENDDPTRPKSHSTVPAQEDLVNVD
ncbi:hypothetical protein KY289_013819 [Solanum tuberosum]|nr:hypothetical protein KY289_013819 [Solanum tuberosum]